MKKDIYKKIAKDVINTEIASLNKLKNSLDTNFKKTVEKIGANIVGHSKFIDHFKFKISDLQKAQKDAKKVGANYVITTEKDLVKIPDINLKIPVYALKTEMHFSPNNKLEDKINSLFI